LINNGLLNTNIAISRQLMRAARTLEAEWRHVLRGSVSTETKEDESSTGRIWTAGFHQVTFRSRLALVLKLINLCFSNFQFFSGRGKPRIIQTADTESVDTGARLYLAWVNTIAGRLQGRTVDLRGPS
jgi:hypothetical protein